MTWAGRGYQDCPVAEDIRVSLVQVDFQDPQGKMVQGVNQVKEEALEGLVKTVPLVQWDQPVQRVLLAPLGERGHPARLDHQDP